MTEERFLRRRDVIAMTGLSKSQIDRMTREGKFPQRVSISTGRTAWVGSEVQAWIAERIAKGRPAIGNRLVTRTARLQFSATPRNSAQKPA